MPFIKTKFPGLLIYEPRIFEDHRGYFYESYNKKLFKEAGIACDFVQDNQVQSCYGVIRGLHYQAPPFAQTKLIRALEGTILDVVVDIRKHSPSHGRVFTIELSHENRKQLLVPAGFAHGYSVLSERAEVFYKCDAFYHQPSERGLFYKDPELEIDWKIPEDKALLSEKDLKQPVFKELKSEFSL